MSKTLPEKMADFMFQGFVELHKIDPIDYLEDGTVTVTISDYSKHPSIIGRSVEISKGDRVFSLAIDMPRAFYYPYLDHELDACINRNSEIFINNPYTEFMSKSQIVEFTSECEALADEDNL